MIYIFCINIVEGLRLDVHMNTCTCVVSKTGSIPMDMCIYTNMNPSLVSYQHSATALYTNTGKCIEISNKQYLS